MFESGKIYGLGLNEALADEVSSTCGASNFELPQLIYTVKECAENFKDSVEAEAFERLWEVGLRSAPFAYETYKRIKECCPRRTVQFIESRSKKINKPITDIRFWVDPILIVNFYRVLKEDGYYGRT